MHKKNGSLLEVLRRRNQQMKRLPRTPSTKLEVLRITNIRNELRRSRKRLLKHITW